MLYYAGTSVGVWIKKRELVNVARGIRSKKMGEHLYKEGNGSALRVRE